MSATDPIAIAEDGMFAFIRKPSNPGEPPQVVSIWNEDDFRFRTFRGAKWRLPSSALLSTVCDLNRSKVADNERSVALRDAHGVDLNNLATLYMCEDRPTEAWKALAEAEQQFGAIGRLFGDPPPPALLDRAVVLHNLRLIESEWPDWSDGDPRASAHELLAAIPGSAHDMGFGFVASALGYRTR